VSVGWSKHKEKWEDRIDRAGELGERCPWARQVLSFYTKVIEFQMGNGPAESKEQPGPPSVNGSLLAAIDFELAAGDVPRLAAMVRQWGPPKLAAEAVHWLESSSDAIRTMIEKWPSERQSYESGADFFARVVLEPQAERLAHALVSTPTRAAGNKCPSCECDPQLAVIRPEGDGGKRMLLCSLCHTEWEFRRILCPNCGEEDHEKLPRYAAEGGTVVRVEACETCRCYLKSVDLTVDGRAVPLVDEVATAPLDLWAVEHGYRKIMPNIMGF